jgi:hypothetical protein
MSVLKIHLSFRLRIVKVLVYTPPHRRLVQNEFLPPLICLIHTIKV